MARNKAELLHQLAYELAIPGWGPVGQETLGRPSSRLLTSPGVLIQLERGQSKTISVEANDPLVNEFGIYISVEADTIKLLSDPMNPVTFGVRMLVLPSFDSANFTFNRPAQRNVGLPVPLAGTALSVHGQRVNVQLKRDDDPDATGVVTMIGAVMPRLPGMSVDSRSGLVSNAAALQEEIPAMARNVRFLTDISVGDVFIYKDPSETIVGTYSITSDMLLKPLPIPKLAVKVEYFTVDVAAKDVLIEFETWM